MSIDTAASVAPASWKALSPVLACPSDCPSGMRVIGPRPPTAQQPMAIPSAVETVLCHFGAGGEAVSVDELHFEGAVERLGGVVQSHPPRPIDCTMRVSSQAGGL